MSGVEPKVDVEPLGEARWARVERGLFAKLDEANAADAADVSTQRRAIAVGAVIVAVAAAALLVVLRPFGRAHVAEVPNRVRLETTESPSQFTVGESSLVVAPRSFVMVGGDDEHGIDVVLDRGMVTCEVAPRHGRPPFVVDAGDVHVRVIGTRFRVTRGAAETSVDVDHGVVEVTAHGVVSILHDGGHYPPAPSVAPDAASPASSSEAVPPIVPPVPVAPVPSSAVPVSPRLRGGAMHGHASTASASTSADAPLVAGAAPPSASVGATSPQQLFEASARIERSRPDEAAATYRQIAAGGSAWSPNALFALARLEADRGHRAESSRLLRDYLTRYPHGINADDARELLERMQ